MTTEQAGNFGEEQVKNVLRELKGTLISGFIRSSNISYYGRNFQMDFLVFVPKIGLVVMEVKNWKGVVKATSDEKWLQEIGSYSNQFGNASLQCLRTCGMLLNILEAGKINKWAIRPLVVFTNDNAKILKANGLYQPQTDIILKSMIPKWLMDNSLNEVNYNFTKSDFEAIKNVIHQYAQEYSEN